MSTHNQVPGSDCERYTASIGALVDETLDTESRRQIDRHLAGCDPCRRLLADLRHIRALAGSLESIEPPTHLWNSVKRRVAADAAPPRSSAGWWWLFGGTALAGVAALVLVVFPGAPVAELPPPARVAGGSAGDPMTTPALELVERQYAEAIVQLERLAADDRASAAPVGRSLVRNLAIIDNAIAESRRAVATAPDSAVARSRLRTGLRRKVTVLQTAVTVAGSSW